MFDWFDFYEERRLDPDFNADYCDYEERMAMEIDDAWEREMDELYG